MEITWYGHSCFLIKDSNERKLLTDPFDDSVGYTRPNEIVDVVTVSHHHFDHDSIENLPGVPNIVDKCGAFYVNDIPLNGIPSYHDDCKGSKRGENTIYVIDMDGFRLCHLGDLGHSLDRETRDMLGKVDILFIPVGGNYTIDGKEAAEIAKDIDSGIVIPMHYKTPVLSFPLDGVENFITNMKNGERINSHTLNVEHKSDEKNRVKIFDYFTS